MEEEGKKILLKFVTALMACTLLLVLIPAVSAQPEPDLYPYMVDPCHYYKAPKGPCYADPWFNLANDVIVKVKNGGSVNASTFNVRLYANDTLVEESTVSGLNAGKVTPIIFKWKPTGGKDPLAWTDTAQGALGTYTDTSKNYTLKVVVDEAKEVAESNETNNNKSVSQLVVWNGYMADEPLENYKHGTVKGGIIYTTGDGTYTSMGLNKYGMYNPVNYNLQIPGTAKQARLYIYYTWAKLNETIGDPCYKCPKIGVTLKTPSGNVNDLSMERSYNDIKGDWAAWRLPWGAYAYNITTNVSESGTYVVNFTNLNHEQGEEGYDENFAGVYANAPPAILVVYENATMPEREYWINEGADVLIGGRRGDGGYLALDECLNNATFPGTVDLSKVKNATLAVVSAWGDYSQDDVLYFNSEELGRGVYCGHFDSCTQELNGISMTIGASGAQVGINATNVTSYLAASNNRVTQGDDGDNMMPTNAFLMVEYEEEALSKPDLVITDKWVCWPDNCTICYNLTNTGNGTAPAGHNTTLYVDGNETAQDEVPVELAPNASYIGCFDGYNWAYTPPEDNITVCADKNNMVDESNESNNCLTNWWMCGDVDASRAVTLTDSYLVFLYLESIDRKWAADVDQSSFITLTDSYLVFKKELNCKCSS